MKIYKKEEITKNKGVVVARQRVCQSQPEHQHEFIELVYLFSGDGIHGIGNREYRVKRGALLFINPLQTHYFRAEEEMEFYNIYLDPAWLSERLISPENAYELLTLAGYTEFQQAIDRENPLVCFNKAERARIERLILDMEQEQQEAQIGGEAVQRAQTHLLLALIFRKMAEKQEEVHSPLTAEFLELIRKRCGERLSLQQLSHSCFYNPSYFSRLFKEHYGMTLREFVKKSRIERARQLLEKSELPIEEIVSQCGFGSRSVFYKQFRAELGISPGEWRKVKKADKEV